MTEQPDPVKLRTRLAWRITWLSCTLVCLVLGGTAARGMDWFAAFLFACWLALPLALVFGGIGHVVVAFISPTTRLARAAAIVLAAVVIAAGFGVILFIWHFATHWRPPT